MPDAGPLRRPEPPAACDELHTLADRVARLTPAWGDLRPYYEARSEIAGDLRRLAASPLLVKRVIRVVRIEIPDPAPPARPTIRRRRVSRRHRYPHPRHADGQFSLPLLLRGDVV
jgi:hypothetical protein